MNTRKVHVEHLHEQVEQDAYAVDCEAVAEAILRRLLLGRRLGADDAGSDPA